MYESRKDVGEILYGDFEWGEGKAGYNQRVHGVSFVEAITVFEDPLAVTKESRKHSVGEYRYVTIGLSARGRLLAVSHTPRPRIRVISARRLTPKERRHYENQAEEF